MNEVLQTLTIHFSVKSDDLQRGLTKAEGTAAASRADAGASPPPSAISPPFGLDRDEEESAMASVRESGVGRPPSLEPEPQPEK